MSNRLSVILECIASLSTLGQTLNSGSPEHVAVLGMIAALADKLINEINAIND